MVKENKKLRKLIGEVISDKMEKTIVVSVNRIVENKLYRKKYTVSKKYKVHDENNEYQTGDVVEIALGKPVSKDKSFVVLRKVS